MAGIFITSFKTAKTRVHKKTQNFFARRPQIRIGIFAATLMLILADFAYIITPLIVPAPYDLGAAAKLLPELNSVIASNIKFDEKSSIFNYEPTTDQNGAQKGIKATFDADISKGITITDIKNNIDFGLKSTDSHHTGRQKDNRIVYPLSSNDGWTVYTIQSTGVKEDVLLTSSKSDSRTFKYELNLGDGLEARIEKNGSLGVYGNTLTSSNITASSDSDAALLSKMRQNADKNTLVFNIPAPIVLEKDGNESEFAHASYKLDGDKLSVVTTGLSRANFPLSIDPSIYVTSARDFMAGNNETNIDFNVDDQLIQKSATTGARFDDWQDTLSLPVATSANGVAAAGGYIYSIGGRSYLGQAFNTQGTDNFVVPAGITSITTKTWGAGGGGGAGGTSGSGGDGGGAGYVAATIPVTPGETLTIYVGGGGQGGGNVNNTGSGGGGGGYSSIYRGGTLLVNVAGGGGGGGARLTRTGGGGGAGGGTTGQNGFNGYATNNGGGGDGGTQSSGGNGGQGGNNSGADGSFLTGGLGADGRSATTGADGGGGFGGLATGGAGGLANVNTTRAAGGGGGAGYYGGGGGGATSSTTNSSGGGGGGGSSYTAGGGQTSAVTNTAGSGTSPGNSGDAVRNGAGQAGGGGAGGQGGDNGSNGAVFISYGSGTEVSKNVSWAEFNTSTGAVQSANPGSGTCAGWCSSNDYSLPSERSNLSLVAYNGYLYAIGGVDTSGNRTNTVYIAKIGANGEPRLWHPTDTNPNNWVYWYQDSNLSSVRSDFTATAYNNRLYLIGGRSTSGPVNNVQIADILPTGKLGSWVSSTSLPSNVYGHGAAIYNDRIYVLGGSNSVGGAPQSNVRYNKINADGTLNNWIDTTPLPTGRFTGGGTMAAVWGAYIYVSSGCNAVNGSGYCTGVSSSIQLASINADGSLDSWNTVGTATDERLGGNLVAWRGSLYRVGGCISQSPTNGDCGQATLDLIRYGKINRDGDASTVGESQPSGTGSCSGGTPTQCNMPGTTYVGNMLTNSFIYNGYLYITGGCTNNSCSTTSNDVVYSAINTDGSISKPATCPDGTYQGSVWCFLSNVLPSGVAASSPVMFRQQIYLVGGLNGSSNTNTILRADLRSDGSLSAWTSQSLSGVGGTNVSYLYAYARANPSSVDTNPGNLFIFGGCTSASSAGCTAYSQNVYKCNIALDGSISSCSTSGQLQVGTVPGATGVGIGIMSGTVYANYIYLIGGVAPGQVDMKTVRYAKFDNNNNVVAVSGSSWVESPNQMAIGRRRTAAFGYNGYIYVAGGFEAGSGVIADIEFIKVNVSDGSLGTVTDGFTTSDVKINQRWGLTVTVSNSYAYVIGGCTLGDSPGGCTTRTDVIQTFQIYNNVSGAPAQYSNAANRYTTNPNRVGGSSVIFNGKIYAAGGCVSSRDCTDAINTVSYASIDVNGAIGTWSNTTSSLPADRTWGKLLTAGNSLYYVGGQGDSASDRRTEVYYGTPNGSGNVTSWSTASNGLPNARTKFGAASWNNRLYIVAGEGTTGSCSGGVCSSVYVSPQLNSGGNIASAWSTSSPNIMVARSGPAVTAYANNLYLFGGYDGTYYHSDSQFAQINPSTGAIGSWTFSTSLTKPVAFGNAFAANGYMYLLGGKSSNVTCDPTTFVAPISANTTIISGNNPTGIGAWYEANQQYAGARYGAGSLYYDGKAYVIGGACATTNDPVVTSITTTSSGTGFSSDSTDHYVSMPGTTASGDLLLMFFSYDSNSNPTVTDPDGAGGWTQLIATNSATNGAIGSVWAKVATGSDGSSVNFATSNSQRSSAQVYLIPADNWYGDITDGIAVNDSSGSTSATRVMPNLVAPWGATNSLWIAYVAGGTYTGVNTYPTGYSGGTHVNGSTGTSGASASTSSQVINVVSETPSNYTMSSSQSGIGFTVAVRPSLPALTYLGSNEIQQTALLSQPQIARYSLLMDTDTDVYPNAWLMNGIDNSVGANWQLKYRSMTNTATYCTSPAMTTWGQETVFGNVTLGLPGVYIPKNGAGVNTNCARFFFFNVSVDSSQSYGYPDDVTRGPTIDSLSLQFTGDPSKRLMHGRTFTGGLQQPVDTPYYSF